MRLTNGRAKICVAPRYASHKWPSFFINMNIVVKHFYFIKDEFYKFAEDPLLMENKENGNKRPCFLAIKDDKNIIWLIPVTSKYEKFKNIYNYKIRKYGSCETIVLGQLLGKDCAFLIQNMFPIIEDYIESEYVQSSNNVPVSISEPLANNIVSKYKKVLALVRAGIKGLVFPNILRIEKNLKTKLETNNMLKH